VVCFAVWLVLDAPSLQTSARESPIGVRRTVSLDILGPIAVVSRGLGLSHVVGWTDDILGRSQGGGPSVAVVNPPPPPKGKGKGGRPTPTSPPRTAPAPTTPTTLPPLNPGPTAADPLRVLVIGDSIGIDLGQPLTNDLAATGVVAATLDGKVDTGLARPDYFNWPEELSADLANDHPQLVVAMLGANDPQSMVVNGTAVAYGTAAWSSEYAWRVGSLMDEAIAGGAHVLWVGMPSMAGSQLNGEMDVINGIVQVQAAIRAGDATYLDSTVILGTAQGTFTPYLTNSSGAEVNIRTPDGIHLTPDGGEVLSQAVMSSMRSALHVALPG